MIKKVIKFALVSSIFAYILYQIFLNWDTVNLMIGKIDISLLCVAFLISILTGIIISLNWLLILRFNGEKVTFSDSTRNWAIANFGKYIPGKIFQYATRIYLFEKLGIRKEQTFIYMIYEIIFMLDSSLLVLAIINILQPVNRFALPPRMNFMIIMVVAAMNALVLYPSIVKKLLVLGSRILRRQTHIDVRIGFRQSLSLILVNVLFWLFYGLSFSCFINSFIPVPMKTHTFLIGVNIIAYLLGYFSILTPSGLGVREGAITYFLSPFSNPGVAGMFSILWRVWGILCEMMYYLLISIVSGRK